MYDQALTDVPDFRVINSKPAGSHALIEDGAAGDPASMGTAVLLASKVTPDDQRFIQGAQEQVDHLINEVPRYSVNNAISQREDEVQLWGDFVYMAPPYLAYYAAFTGDRESQLLMEAYNNIKGYRDVLRDPDTGLWHHILLGSYSDTNLWGTGHAWATAGTVRVIQTMLKSQVSRLPRSR